MKALLTRLLLLAPSLLLAAPAARADQNPEGVFYAYRTSQTLEAGRPYTIETLNLQKRDLLQYDPPATYILVIDPEDGVSGTLVAHGGVYDSSLRSRVRFTPSVTKSYRIVVTSNSTVIPYFPASFAMHLQCGRADFRIRDESTGFARVNDGISFCGQSHYVEHHAGECFRSNAAVATVNPYLYFVPTGGYTDIQTGAAVRWDDNSGGLNNAELCFEDDGSGWILSTATTISGEGPGTVDLVEHTFLKNASSQVIQRNMAVPLSYVFRRSVQMNANTLYLVQTANLGKRDTFQWPAPDTVMYIVDRAAGRVLARNDDGFPGSFTSQIAFIAPESKAYDIIVRARNRSTPGNLDLFVNHLLVADNQPFAGEMLRPMLKGGLINGQQDCIETDYLSGNPYLIWFPHPTSSGDYGDFVVMDDSDGVGVNARVCFNDFRRFYPTGDVAKGMLVLGSSAASTEGNTGFEVTGSNHY
jgi:hypothetical protein